MPIQIIKRDITKMSCDIIVNPTDDAFSGSGGVDYQIHRAAGPEMERVCASFPPLETGNVQETPGYKLPCKYVIHTVGPVWSGGRYNEPLLLRSCYINSLILALKLGAKSIAFPLISSGTFGFPKDQVLRLALLAISDYLFVNDSDLDVFVCVIDRDSYELGIGSALDHYLEVASNENLFFEERCASTAKFLRSECPTAIMSDEAIPGLENWLKQHDDSFAVTLLKLIDKKGMTDAECYKKANISRKTFSKINTDKDYRPSKQTVIAFAIALELDLDETEQLLRTVGFSLSHSDKFDLIIEFCIRQQLYDVLEINEILYKYDQMCLGC